MTIRSVADAAGVSIATVSRVMSGQSVRSELADRVRSAAEDLGYQPNPSAQGLVSGLNRTVGVVVPDLANPYFNGVLKALNVDAARAGFRTLVADSDNDENEELEISRNLLRYVDGLVLVSPRMPSESLHVLAKESTNVVLVNRVAVGLGLPTVAVDAFGAMLELCGHLARLGHKKLAYLEGPAAAWQSVERRRAVEHAAAFGLDVAFVPAGPSIQHGHDAVDEALTHKPTALVAFNDLVALGALSRLRELNLRVPEDISLTGTDDIAFARFSTPSLTTTAAPQRRLGEGAWGLISAVMAGESAEESPLLKAEMVVRDSTGPAAR
ncbi:LacI family DNA-binding transcriptional regulator [Saccharopolyspora sp. NPDC049426]|uniref:LacI family DNA-binding transcriptional regulator n=1 Tax=Saccharopolyspora sp. NPDC049426 TaxID=3155652 RepID=UPI003420B516